MTNVVAIIFAHNEGVNLSHAIEQIRNAGKFNHIIVVDDGSTDSTAMIAKRDGVIVVGHEKNLGKRAGFISGALKAKELGADVLFTFDADVKNIGRRTFSEMFKEVTSNGKLMAVATQHEAYPFDDWRKGRVADPHSNAQRAINMKALDPLFNGDEKWINAFTENKRKWNSGKYSHVERKTGYKWALEYALDRLIPWNKVVFWVGEVVNLQPYRTGSNSIRAQLYGREIVNDQLKNRRGIAKSLMSSIARRDPVAWSALRKKWLAKKKAQKVINLSKIKR